MRKAIIGINKVKAKLMLMDAALDGELEGNGEVSYDVAEGTLQAVREVYAALAKVETRLADVVSAS